MQRVLDAMFDAISVHCRGPEDWVDHRVWNSVRSMLAEQPSKMVPREWFCHLSFPRI